MEKERRIAEVSATAHRSTEKASAGPVTQTTPVYERQIASTIATIPSSTSERRRDHTYDWQRPWTRSVPRRTTPRRQPPWRTTELYATITEPITRRTYSWQRSTNRNAPTTATSPTTTPSSGRRNRQTYSWQRTTPFISVRTRVLRPQTTPKANSRVTVRRIKGHLVRPTFKTYLWEGTSTSYPWRTTPKPIPRNATYKPYSRNATPQTYSWRITTKPPFRRTTKSPTSTLDPYSWLETTRLPYFYRTPKSTDHPYSWETITHSPYRRLARPVSPAPLGLVTDYQLPGYLRADDNILDRDITRILEQFYRFY